MTLSLSAAHMAEGPQQLAHGLNRPSYVAMVQGHQYFDLNTDWGQTRDLSWLDGAEADPENCVLKHFSSVNIPCCVHDGDPVVIRRAIKVAKAANCLIGAHIAYPDPSQNGYQPVQIDNNALDAWIQVQIGTLSQLAQGVGAAVEQVRPHGALYSAFINQPEVALQVAKSLYAINPWLVLIGPAGPILSQAADEVGIRIAPEVVLGRYYNAQGQLAINRFHQHLTSIATLAQAKQLLQERSVTSLEGRKVPLDFQSIHLSLSQPDCPMVAEKLIGLMGNAVPVTVASIGESGWV
jgi:UPF0271 protein